jgi:hypothetical protein
MYMFVDTYLYICMNTNLPCSVPVSDVVLRALPLTGEPGPIEVNIINQFSKHNQSTSVNIINLFSKHHQKN